MDLPRAPRSPLKVYSTGQGTDSNLAISPTSLLVLIQSASHPAPVTLNRAPTPVACQGLAPPLLTSPSSVLWPRPLRRAGSLSGMGWPVKNSRTLGSVRCRRGGRDNERPERRQKAGATGSDRVSRGRHGAESSGRPGSVSRSRHREGTLPPGGRSRRSLARLCTLPFSSPSVPPTSLTKRALASLTKCQPSVRLVPGVSEKGTILALSLSPRRVATHLWYQSQPASRPSLGLRKASKAPPQEERLGLGSQLACPSS